MKFRILEVKPSFQRERYYPQYKSWLFWKNIGEHYFRETIYSKTQFYYKFDSYVYDMEEANKIVKEFKLYIEEKERYYSIIHPIN